MRCAKRTACGHVVVDAAADTDLGIIGEAVGDDRLVTGGSGVALGLPAAYRRRGLLQHKPGADTLPKIGGASAVLAGSCSAATLGQIAALQGRALALDTDAICRGEGRRRRRARLGQGKLGQRPNPFVGERHAPSRESVAGEIRRREVESGESRRPWPRSPRVSSSQECGRLIVAGGETSGAVVRRTRCDRVAHRARDRSRRAVDRLCLRSKPLLLALKSGNFGAPDFFTKAFHRI